MYLDYWGFAEKPFENTPDPRFLYYSTYHEEAYARLKYAIQERKGAALLTGEYGSGKTVISRALVNELLNNNSSEVALIVNPAFSALDLLWEIAFQFLNRKLEKSKIDILHELNDFLYENHKKGRNSVVIIDEAQTIESESLFDEIRLLLNFQLNDRFLLTLILLGQPELKVKINRVPQLKERLAISYHLLGLEKSEVYKYIIHRMKVAGLNPGKEEKMFKEDTVERIADYSEGIPRRINTVCEFALLEGMFESKEQIDKPLINKVLEDLPI